LKYLNIKKIKDENKNTKPFSYFSTSVLQKWTEKGQ